MNTLITTLGYLGYDVEPENCIAIATGYLKDIWCYSLDGFDYIE